MCWLKSIELIHIYFNLWITYLMGGCYIWSVKVKSVYFSQSMMSNLSLLLHTLLLHRSVQLLKMYFLSLLSFFQYHLQINKEQFFITFVSSDFFLSLLIRFTMNKGTINLYRDNKKMQHSCGVTYSIALSYQFQNTTILVNLFQLHQI